MSLLSFVANQDKFWNLHKECAYFNPYSPIKRMYGVFALRIN